MRKKYLNIAQLIALALTISSCATQDPAPVEYSSGAKAGGFSKLSKPKMIVRNIETESLASKKEENVLVDKYSSSTKKYISEEEEIEPKNTANSSEGDLDNIEKELGSSEPSKTQENTQEIADKADNENQTHIVPANTAPQSSFSIIMPADGKIIAKFGDLVNGAKNNGINIALSHGESIRSVASGTVVAVRKDGRFGNLVIIKHNSEFQSAYAHLATIDVSNGQIVTAGEEIGTDCNTGSAEEVRLLFALRKGKVSVDPM